MRIFFIITLFLASLSPAVAQDSAYADIGSRAIRAHTTFLADDLLEGRDAGTTGYDIAARYVAAAFDGIGLRPANDGKWFQEVPFVQLDLRGNEHAVISVGGHRLSPDARILLSNEGETRWVGEAVFAGYGITSKSNGLDEIGKLDVRGKVVVVFEGAPFRMKPDDTARYSDSYKELGAVGLIRIATSDAAAARKARKALATSGAETSTAVITVKPPLMLDRPIAKSLTNFEIFIDPSDARHLFEGASTKFDDILSKADRGERLSSFDLSQTVSVSGSLAAQRFHSPNVIGLLPGSDPKLSDEFILVIAHLDGLGADNLGVKNGALDNAAGVAILIETARAFAETGNAPRRSILFAAVTAEEDGLLGSQWLSDNPMPHAENIVGVVNLDMPVLLYDFKDIVAFGSDQSTIGITVEAALKSEGLSLSPDPIPEQGIFRRSDHYSFVKRGIPSVFLLTGFANGGEQVFENFMSNVYHTVGDNLSQPIDWSMAARFARVNFAVTKALADADQRPLWYEDSPIGRQFAKGELKAKRAPAD